ncbi:MAG: hypothetical protein AABX29_09480 [Nanoarchaeota archaeon]
MTLKDIQRQVDGWVQQFKAPYWDPAHIYLTFGEESGELAREINHRYGSKRKKAS